jgi:hypothetical protein
VKKWDPSTLPIWLDEDFYKTQILPRLQRLTAKKICLTIDVSAPYALLIKRGERVAHPRHWLELANLTNVRT